MKHLMNQERLAQNLPATTGDGGPCPRTRPFGFRPAFFDFATCCLYLSRFANGQPAPIHLLEGLPEEAVALRSPCGRVLAARATLILGFERDGYFFTRTAAARAMAEWSGLRPTH